MKNFQVKVMWLIFVNPLLHLMGLAVAVKAARSDKHHYDLINF